MFTPIDRLPQFDPEARTKYQERWDDQDGQTLRETILAMIRVGAGEDFLQGDFEAGRLGFLENMHDLKGLNIFQEQFNFPGGDTFENIDLSYAQLWHSSFTNAVFMTNMAFTKAYNCEFKSCIFTFNHAYGATFEKCRFVECEFVENNTFTNCSLRDVAFENCFMPTRVFFDCSFDQLTRIGDSASEPFRMKPDSFPVDPKKLSDVLGGIEEAYRAGGVTTRAREYFFRRMQAVTRYNSDTRLARGFGFLKEWLAGYGVRPFRVLGAMFGALLISATAFSIAVGNADGMMLAAGALFTFGAKAHLLDGLGLMYQVLYVLTAFVGISLTAMFITVLANVWFREP